MIDKNALYAWTTGSDAHYPEHVGYAHSVIECGELSFRGISEALKGKKVSFGPF
jgi:PHP family Zn ribbon phosphoesterase